jgi:hypothetical protein
MFLPTTGLVTHILIKIKNEKTELDYELLGGRKETCGWKNHGRIDSARI